MVNYFQDLCVFQYNFKSAEPYWKGLAYNAVKESILWARVSSMTQGRASSKHVP